MPVASEPLRTRTACEGTVQIRAGCQQVAPTILNRALINILAALSGVDEVISGLANAIAMIVVRERIRPARNAGLPTSAEEAS